MAARHGDEPCGRRQVLLVIAPAVLLLLLSAVEAVTGAAGLVSKNVKHRGAALKGRIKKKGGLTIPLFHYFLLPPKFRPLQVVAGNWKQGQTVVWYTPSVGHQGPAHVHQHEVRWGRNR